MKRCASLFLSLTVAVAAIVAVPAKAETRSLAIEKFEAEVVVLDDGVIRVRETITARFEGQWNGIYRTIPIEYRTPQGFSYRLLVEPRSATDANGNALKLESSRERHYLKLKIWVPQALDTTKTITLEYRVDNGLKFFEDHDELYWNVTGDEWDVPLESASATITLPETAKGVRATAFTGAYGSTANEADVKTAGSAIQVRMRRLLAFREGLTVAVAWDKGAVAEPGAIGKGVMFLRANWPLGAPVLVFALMAYLWHHYGRDPRLKPIVARYEPPDGLSPAEVGTLVDDRPDLRDVTATLVDLAVRGFVRIEEKDESKMFGLWSSKGHSFELLRPRSEWKDLVPHERTLLDAVFTCGTGALEPGAGPLARVSLSDLENKFYKDLPDVKDRIFERLMERGYYLRRPDSVRKFFLVIGGVVGIGGAVLGGNAAGHFTLVAPMALIVAAVLSGAIIAGFGWFMPARTIRGTEVLEGALGFEEFLGRVEGERMDKMIRTPEMFEKFLPFAMALGVESNWAKAFEDIYKEPPRWYHGGSPTGFRPSSLTSSLGRMSAAAGTAMASAPRSSGGSGFGGGGRSGGGFGGGGGGGF